MTEKERALDLLCEQAVFPYKSMERQAKLGHTSGDRPGHTRDEPRTHTHTHARSLTRSSHHDMQAEETAITCPLHYDTHTDTHTYIHSCIRSQLAEDITSRGWMSRQGYFHSKICSADYWNPQICKRFHVITPNCYDYAIRAMYTIHKMYIDTSLYTA